MKYRREDDYKISTTKRPAKLEGKLNTKLLAGIIVTQRK